MPLTELLLTYIGTISITCLFVLFIFIKIIKINKNNDIMTLRYLTNLILFFIGYTFNNLLIISLNEYEFSKYLVRISYTYEAFICTLILIIILSVNIKTASITKKYIGYFWAYPTVAAFFTLTNNAHLFIFKSIEKDVIPFNYIVEYNFGYYINNSIQMLLICISITIMAYSFFQNTKKNKLDVLNIMLSTLISIVSLIVLFLSFDIRQINFFSFVLFIPMFFVYYAFYFYLVPSRDICVEHMNDAYFLFTFNGNCIDYNTAASEFLINNLERTEINYSYFQQTFGIQKSSEYSDTEVVLKIKGMEKHYLISSFKVSNNVIKHSAIGFILKDITASKKTMVNLDKIANVDPLTGAKNRRFFDKYTTQLVESYSIRENETAILMLDLDYFKKVNDVYGHYVGDQVLKSFSSICQKQIRQNDLLCRFGGEEFIIVLENSNETIAKTIAERIRSTVENHVVRVDNVEIKFTVSSGICLFRPYNLVAVQKAVEEADKQLYIAKSGGRNRFEFTILKD